MTISMTTSFSDPRELMERHHRLVTHCVKKFQKRYGGDWIELFSAANWEFWRACLVYDKSKCPDVHGWVCQKVWFYLLSQVRKEAKRKTKTVTLDEDGWKGLDRGKPSTPSRFDIEVFLKTLSRKGRELVRIALDSRACTEPEEGLFWRLAVRKQLENSLVGEGWSQRQIRDTFTEVFDSLRRFRRGKNPD